MNFLKESKEYLLEELKGCISNSFRFTIKDLYKKEAHRIVSDVDIIDCEHCGVFLTSNNCLYCGEMNDDGLN